MEQQRHGNNLFSLHVSAGDLNTVGIALWNAGEDDLALEMYQEAISTLTAASAQKPAEDEGASMEQVIRRRADMITFGRDRLSELVSSGKSPSRDNSVNDVDTLESFKTTRLFNEPQHFVAVARHDYTVLRNISAASFNMALVYLQRKNYVMAEKLFRIVVEKTSTKYWNVDDCGDSASTSVYFSYASLNNLGYISFTLGRFEEAAKFFSQSLRLVHEHTVMLCCDDSLSSVSAEEEILHHHSNVMSNHALTLFFVAESCEEEGSVERAMAIYVKIAGARQRILSQLQEVCGPFVKISDPQSSMIHSLVLYRMGSIFHSSGDLERATRSFELALSLRREATGNHNEDVASLLHDIGVVRWEGGYAHDAMTAFQECFTLRRSLYGDGHKDVAEVLFKIGQVYQGTKRYHEAFEAYSEALRIEKNILGTHHQDITVTLTNIAQVLYALGHFNKALEAYDEVLIIVRKTLGDDHPCIIEIENAIGSIHLNLGNKRDAEMAFAEAERVEQLSCNNVMTQHQHNQCIAVWGGNFAAAA